MSKTDESFLRALKGAEAAEALAVKILRQGRYGYDAHLTPKTVRKHKSDWKHHVDPGDIIINPGSPEPLYVQVKNPDKVFTGMGTFRFKTVLIDEVYKLKGRTNVLGYMIFNIGLTHYCEIGTLQNTWDKGIIGTEWINEREDGSRRLYYSAHKKHFKWRVVADELVD